MSHKKLIATLLAVAVGMFGFGFAMVPLYEVFCEITGVRLENGNGRVADNEAPEQVTERWVRVHLDAAVDRGLPWTFGPDEKFLRVRVGELTETTYRASNRASQAVIGHAVPSVAPVEASIYFAKTECFCFTEQLLEAGETREMPVRFVIDPELPADIKELTLSYRFYNTQDNGRLSRAD